MSFKSEHPFSVAIMQDSYVYTSFFMVNFLIIQYPANLFFFLNFIYCLVSDHYKLIIILSSSIILKCQAIEIFTTYLVSFLPQTFGCFFFVVFIILNYINILLAFRWNVLFQFNVGRIMNLHIVNIWECPELNKETKTCTNTHTNTKGDVNARLT